MPAKDSPGAQRLFSVDNRRGELLVTTNGSLIMFGT